MEIELLRLLRRILHDFNLSTLDAYDHHGDHYWKFVLEGKPRKWAQFVDGRTIPKKLIGMGDTVAEAVDEVYAKWRELSGVPLEVDPTKGT